MRRFFGSRWGVLLALFLVTGIGAGGGSYLLRSYAEIRAGQPELALYRLRVAFVGLAELERYVAVLNAMSDDAASTDDARNELRKRLDIITVRLGSLENDRGFAAQASSRKLLDAFREIIARSERLIDNNFDDLEAEKALVYALLRSASSSLIDIANEQHRIERKAVAEQTRRLDDMVVAAEILLLLFVAISVAVLLLLRAEVRARIRASSAEAKSRYLAYFDTLTTLPNRAYFYQNAAKEVGAETAPAVVIIDLDDFKLINDNYGHDVGDQFLVKVAERLQETAKSHSGVVARLGGDEFAALLPNHIGESGVRAFCQDVIDRVGRPLIASGVEILPKASIGAVLGDVSDGANWEFGPLLKAADKALYSAKMQGKNGYMLFNDELRRELAEEAALHAGIDRAIETGELFLLLQPQIDIRDGKIIGAEALVRWRRDGAVVPPGMFIDAAEKTGKIRDIDHAVLDMACATLAEWRAVGTPVVPISVNLSAAHFSDNTIVERVVDVLRRHDIPPSLLTLEITETMLLDDWDRVLRVFESLRAIGVNMALDDFGTGFSSIGYLRRMRVDELKIDRSLILDVEDSSQARALLVALSALAQALEIKTVVEGVETEAQTVLLRGLGFNIAQGFFYSRPVPEPDLREWIADGRRFAQSTGRAA